MRAILNLAQIVEPLAHASAAMQWLVGVWLVVLGGCVGSFMNVVIYRLPAGMSIVHPRSRCPKCERPIRAFDNVPVFSWLLLGGRCRDCGAAISGRYPAVEALVAGIFLALAIVEVFSGGANLPRFTSATESRAFTLPESLLWVLYASHTALLCTFICAAFIHYDHKPVPWRLFVPALVLGGFVWMAWPELRPLPTRISGAFVGQARPIDGMLGLAAGGLLGMLTYPITIHSPQRRSALVATGFQAALCGLVLGWPITAAVTVIATLSFLCVAVATRLLKTFSRVPWSAYLTMAVALAIMNWRALVERLPWLGPDAEWATLGGAAASVLLLSLASARIDPHATSESTSSRRPRKRKRDARRSKRDAR